MSLPTLFTVPGTGGRTMRTLIGSSLGNAETMIGEAVDPTLWDWVDVHYPGDSLTLNSFVRMDQTEAQGAQILIDLIEATPGRFGIVGMSQGAAVISTVYNEIRYGSLQHRGDDFLTGVALGNPRRQTGFAVGTDPGVYRGVAATHGAYGSGLLTECDSRWREFANPHDVATDVGNDSYGEAVQAVFEFFYENYTGPASFKDYITDQWGQGALTGLVGSLQDAISIISSLSALALMGFDMLGAVIAPAIINDPDFHTNGHFRYHFPYLNVAGNTTLSAVELAVIHLNNLAYENAGGTVDTLLADGLATIEGLERAELALRRQEPLVRIWDGDWNLQHILSCDYKSQFSWISNDSGPGQSEIPYGHPVAKWIADDNGRIDRDEHRNVHVTVDYCGARWSGRMDKFSIELREDGDKVLIVDWLHDYEHLKWITCWSNPFLPAAFQFPRAWMLAGPVDWILKLTLFANIVREHNPLITWPDDPLDLTQWFTSLDMSQWHMVVAPNSFLSAVESGVVWGIIFSRWQNFHDMAHVMLEDAELSVTMTRWLEGDPEPWGGANLRNGCLIMDIVDKSGVYVGTANGGTIFDGMIRTVAEFVDDFVDSTANVLEDNPVPADYWTVGHKYTDKALPYVIYMEGDNSPLQSSAFINSPSKAVQVSVGGHSMPGVNEAISASIQAAGDILGGIAQIGSLGGTVDALLKPLYEDVILAWWSIKSSQRAQTQGWSRYFEYFQDVGGGGMQAYTLTSLMAIRAGMWATKTTVTWKVSVADGIPFVIGDRGIGHFFLDDRVGLVLDGDETGTIHMDRCRKLDLAWDPENPPEWTINIGDDRLLQDPAQRAFGKIEAILAGLNDLGVW